jgi:hypothetical protein
MDPSETLKLAGFWLELKRAWHTWQQGEPMPALSDAARAYFEAVSFDCLNSALKALGSVHANVPPMRSGQEAWAHVFHYLIEERPRAALRVLDDIFLRAANAARATTADLPVIDQQEELAHQIGWILNQFHMRVRDVARAYAVEHGTPSETRVTGSLHKPVGGTDTEVTLLDIMSFMDPNWATAMEREELRTLGGDVVEAFFPTVRTAFKLRLYLRLLRENRDVTISVANPTVLELAGIGRSVFAESASQVLGALAAQVAEKEAYQELDREARMYFLGYAAMSLSDRTELWTHLGHCVREFLAENEKAGPKDQVPPRLIVERAEAFADLLLQELKKKDALLSENELEPLFTAIATARRQYGQ